MTPSSLRRALVVAGSVLALFAWGRPVRGQQLPDSSGMVQARATWAKVKAGAHVRFWQDRPSSTDAYFLGLAGGSLRFRERTSDLVHLPDPLPQAIPFATVTRMQLFEPASARRRFALLGVLGFGGLVTVANAATCESGSAPGYCLKRIGIDVAVTTLALALVRGRQWRELHLPPPPDAVGR